MQLRYPQFTETDCRDCYYCRKISGHDLIYCALKMWPGKQYYITSLKKFMSKRMARLPNKCMAYVSMKDGELVPKEYDFLGVGLNTEAKESGITVSGKKLGPTN